MKRFTFLLFTILFSAFIWQGMAQSYCVPTGSSNNGDEIRNFTLSNLNNDSVASEGENGYSDYSNTVSPALLQAAVPYVASLTSGTGSGSHGAAIWIDLNQNGVFEASEMLAFIPSSIGANTTADFPEFTIPADTPLETYKLRVQYHYNKSGEDLDPCVTTSSFSETEDYSVTVQAPPSCLGPTNLLATNITADSADLSWTAGDDETVWEVLYGEVGFDIETEGTTVTVNDDAETTLTDLDHSTMYDVYVRAMCSEDDVSAWVGSETFATLCSITVAPWSEDFEGGIAGSILIDDFSCWSQEYESETQDWKLVSQNGNSSVEPRSGSLMAEFRNSSTGSATKLVSPVLDMSELTTPKLTFYFANVNWLDDIDQLRVYYKVSVSDTEWILIPDAVYIEEHAEWEKVELLLPETDGATDYLIAFEGTSSWARGLNLDDISISDANATDCDPVSDLTVETMSPTLSQITWSGNAEDYQIAWGVSPYQPGDEHGSQYTTGDVSSYYIATSASTEYDVHVRAICDESESVWTTISFTTGEAVCESPLGITVNYVTGDGAEITWSPANEGDDQWEISLAKGGQSADQGLIAVVNDTPSFTATGLEAETEYSVYLRTICSDEVSSDWAFNGTFTTLEGTQEPECDAVTDVEVSEITAETATVSWTASATAVDGYVVNVYEAGADVDTDTAVFTEVVGVGVTTIDVTGLTHLTSYDVYVTSDCGSGETAISDVVTFTTDDIASVGDFGFVKLTLYPNPVSTDLNISAAKVIDEVQVYNILGQRVMTHKSNNTEVTLDVTRLPSATYVLKVSVEGVMSTARFIKK